MKILRASLAAFAVAALAAAPSADAAKAKPKPKAKTHSYSLTWKGWAEMNWEGETNEEIGGRTEGGFALTYRGSIGRIVMKGNDVVKTGTPSSRATMLGNTTETTWDRYIGTSTTIDCKVDDKSFAFGSSSFSNGLLVALNSDALLVFRPFERMEFEAKCDQGSPHRWQLDAIQPEGIEPELGMGVFDAEFDLPAETLGMGKIIQKVNSKPGQAVECGIFLGGLADYRKCEANWGMTLTFTKLRKK